MAMSIIERRDLVSSSFDLNIARGSGGWQWDTAVTYGVGRLFRRRVGLRLGTGLRYSGWTDGNLRAASGVPLEALVRVYATRFLAVQLMVRPSWNLSGGATRAASGPIASFSDEFAASIGAVFGRPASRALAVGLLVGVRYQEIRGGQWLGLYLGAGYINKP